MSPFVLRSKVNDQSGSSKDSCPGSGFKVICCYRSGNLQVKMRMSVNKARKQKLSGYVHHLGVLLKKRLSHADDLLSFHQHVQLFPACT